MAQITIQKSKISVTKSNSKITERKQLEQTIEWLESAQQLKEKQTGNYLEEFISSLSDLFPSINRQRKFLWIFRLIVWSVPITFIFCAFLKSKA